MLVPALLLPLLAAAQPAQPITVIGHAWAPFISPMGEPFRAHTARDDTLGDWFNRADADHDGLLTLEEMKADAGRFFRTLDEDANGEIGPEELVRYEWDVAPDIQVNSRTRRAPGDTSAKPRPADADRGMWRPGRGEEDKRRGGLQGAARYALLNIPEPVAAADANLNRAISFAEFTDAASSRFQLLDSTRSGKVSLAQLQALRAALLAAGRVRRRANAPDPRIAVPIPVGD
ncbi:MAG: EF-hand domain-containing protein [Sphingomicrobium sp.]